MTCLPEQFNCLKGRKAGKLFPYNPQQCYAVQVHEAELGNIGSLGSIKKKTPTSEGILKTTTSKNKTCICIYIAHAFVYAAVMSDEVHL